MTSTGVIATTAPSTIWAVDRPRKRGALRLRPADLADLLEDLDRAEAAAAKLGTREIFGGEAFSVWLGSSPWNTQAA